ncbi:MAG: A/G-specific adenine glycosylase [Cytophagales bacterium]|nr:A/G-specific adenine glycosylase [Bernardetiaceae bacterium]MDW8209894.1 A/G-specific adenine glycosylase [Cytophagales bacterium]
MAQAITNLPFFGKLLREWYQGNKRNLPWRHTSDPYLIWLSEVILQQTRVAQGLPYYEKLVAAFPTVHHLAAASEEEVLRLWQGLGYYSRARHMHATARLIVQRYNGKFPISYKELLQLKGIGPYTAAAIASFAYNEPIAVVDGNVYRVLARIFGITDDISSTKGKKIFAQYAQQLLEQSVSVVAPSLYNQAIMEFGAIQCTPLAPACSCCIFSHCCYAYLHQQQQQLPVKEKKLKTKQRHWIYLIIEHQGYVLVKMRQSGDIWQGLYDFPLVEERSLSLSHSLLGQIYSEVQPMLSLTGLAKGVKLPSLPVEVCNISDVYKHPLTHQVLQVRFVHLVVLCKELWQELQGISALKVVSWKELDQLPKPILVVNYLRKAFF